MRLAFLVLAIAVAVGTIVPLRLPGTALSKEIRVLKCSATGNEAHTHDASCYDEEGNLVCPLTERALHTHDESCYTEVTSLVCGLEESEGHVHTEECYAKVRGELICAEHVHTEECYAPVRGELICENTDEDHEHTDECYAWSDELICGIENDGHEHTDECYAWSDELICGKKEGEGAHIHGEGCYETGLVLSCGLEEATELHVHGDSCFEIVTIDADEPDPTADVEGTGTWNNMFASIVLSGNWRQDLVTIAQTQLGYEESKANYRVEKDGTRNGYTRYGAWYGLPYDEWCATFIGFCMEYAQIPQGTLPFSPSATRWADALEAIGIFESSEDYEPAAGDLVFFLDEETKQISHMGLVEKIEEGILSVIEGNVARRVLRIEYTLDDKSIAGYGVMPSEASDAVTIEGAMPAQRFEETLEDLDLTVLVEADEGTFPAKTVMTVVPVEEEATLDTIAAAAEAENESAGMLVTSLVAVDITFTNEAGEKIEPLKAVRVTMTGSGIEGAQASTVVHVDSEGEAKIVDQNESGLDQVVFDADAFSVYGIIGAKAKTADVTVEIGGTATVKGAGNKKHHWSSNDTSVATVAGSGSTATVTGVNTGNTVITHTYQGGSETFTVSVVDPYSVEDTTGNLTVTVKDTGNARKLSDYILVVDPIRDENELFAEYESIVKEDTGINSFGFLNIYHIYLADQNGEAVNLEGQNANLKVTMTYFQTPSGWPTNKDISVGHYSYKVNNTDSIRKKSISGVTVSGNSVTFIIHDFSTITLSARSSGTTSGGTPVTTQQGSILNGFSFDDANEWQIVAEQYSNNGPENKTSYGNDSYQSVRVQKNVIPTGIENEFYVYLSVDLKQLLREWLTYALYDKASQNNWGAHNGYEVGDVVPSMDSQWSAFTANPDLGYSWYTNIDVIGPDGSIILYDLPIYSNQNQNNTTVFLKLDDDHFVLFGESVRKGQGSNSNRRPQCKLGEEALAMVESMLIDVYSLGPVTDTLGAYIEFLGVVDGDYSEEPSVENGILSWTPVVKDNPEEYSTGTGTNKVTWWTNAAELIYKVRLDVTKDSFNSCADNMDSGIGDPESYEVNQNAVLPYTLDLSENYNVSTTGTVTFQKPYVRGMLYDIKIKKVDQDGEPLSGVQFTLTGTSDNTDADIAGTAASAVSEDDLVTGEDGYVTITELPWGTYTLTEILPDGYSAEQLEHIAELCHTTNESNLSASAIDPTREMLTDWSPYLTIVNKRNYIEVEKLVIIDKTLDPEFDEAAVDQTIYIALWDANTNSYLMGSDGKILVKPITIIDGEVDPSSIPVTFGVSEPLPNHVFYVSELIRTEDVNPEDIPRIQSSAYADDEHEYVYGFGNLTFIGTDSEGNDAVYQIKTPIAHTWNYETGQYNTNDGRIADLSGANEKAKVRFDNTYTPETMIEFIVQKRWGRRTIASDGTWGMAPLSDALLPEGASVTITLYQSIDGGEWSTYKSIILDGVEDSDGEDTAWRAVFRDLPKFDTDETSVTFALPYSYRANETAKPDEFEPFDSVTDHTVMGQHGNDEDDYINNTGGIIYNIQKTIAITVKKVDENGDFLTGATFKLMGPDINNNESLIKEFTITSDEGATIDNLVSGDYKLIETEAPRGYIILTDHIGFSVNALPGDGEDVITWNGGSRPDTVTDDSPSTTSEQGDTITVINTPGQALPLTGGIGTLPYALGGTMLITASAVMYGFRMRRRERRFN